MNLSTVVSSATGVVAVAAYVAIARPRSRSVARWWLPAALCGAFSAWTTYAVIDGGLLGFWKVHIGAPWNTQVWMDLLILGGTAWYLLQPRLRSRGIRPLPWLVLIVATGSIGMLALLARLLHAEAGAPEQTQAPELPSLTR